MRNNIIKFGVSLYGFQEKFYTKEKDLEDLISITSQIENCKGIEVVGQQSFPNCPNTNEKYIRKWNELLWKYGMIATANDFFIDISLYKNRHLTLNESLKLLEKYLEFSKKAGFRVMRIGGSVDPNLMKYSIPLLEKYDIKLGIEIHSGSSTFDMPIMQEVFDVIFKEDSKYLGVVPDMSLFCKKLSPITLSNYDDSVLRSGFKSYLKEKYQEDPVNYQEFVKNEIRKSKYSNEEKELLEWTSRSEWHDPKILIDFMPYIVHFHGKFWEMDDNGIETTIGDGYDEVLSLLVKYGYEGYISSEYEGRGMSSDGTVKDCFDQVIKHQKMMDKIVNISNSKKEA